MIGFIAFNPGIVNDGEVIKAIDNMSMHQLHHKYQMEDLKLILYKNDVEKNNYMMEDEEQLIVVIGTIIFKGCRGINAVRALKDEMPLTSSPRRLYDQISGHYNLIQIDKKKLSFRLINDKVGLQNCFYYSQNSKLIISSNLLLMSSLIDTSINEQAVREYLNYGTCFEWKTLYQGIYRARPATSFLFSDTKWKQSCLWKLSARYPYLKDSSKEIIKKADKLLDSDITNTVKKDRPKILLDLTGGSDSRTILSYLLKQNISLTGSTAGPEDHIDVTLARKISKRLKFEHLWWDDGIDFEVDEKVINQAIELSDGCFSPFSLIKSLPYYQYRSKHFDIVLGGNAGPLSKDHYWLYEFNLINRLREPNWGRIIAYSMSDHPIQDDLFRDRKQPIREHLKSIFTAKSREIKGTNNQKLDYVYFALKSPDFLSPLISLANRFYDVYQPLINPDFIEYMININPTIRKRNNLQFSLIFKNNKELAWIKTDNGCPTVPSLGLYRILVIYVLWRYFKAFLRKFHMVFLKKTYNQPVHSAAPIAKKLQKLGYFKFLDYDRLSIKSIISKERYQIMLSNPEESSNLNYLLGILSIELFEQYRKTLKN